MEKDETVNINFQLSLDKKSRLTAIAEANHRDLSNQMRFIVDQFLAENDKTPRKAKKA